MRIFQSIDATANASVTGNKTWYRNLYEPLVEMGHDVVLFDAAEGRKAFNQKNLSIRDKFSQHMLDLILIEHSRKPFDLFFSYFIDGMVDPEIISRIHKLGIPAVNFSCNNAHQFHLVEKISPYFDYSLHAERDANEKFIAIGANPIWFPMASNPNYFKPMDVSRTIESSFVGGNYANRAKYIHHLLSNGINVQVFGPGWQWGAKTPLRSIAKHFLFLFKTLSSFSTEDQSRASALLAEHDFRRNLGDRFPDHVYPPVSDDRLISLYSESHVSLGFLEVFDRHDPSAQIVRHLHLREFEAPMCGALYCTGYSDELSEHFEPEKEIITYRNSYELLDKVRYYLAHPLESERIRKAGHVRALADHTYQHRFRTLFRKIGLKA